MIRSPDPIDPNKENTILVFVYSNIIYLLYILMLDIILHVF